MTVRHTANIKTATVNKVAGLSKQAERDALARDFGLESFTPQPGMIYTRVRAISARVNRNFDGFESSELKRAYTTFEGRPVFVNHENHDPTRTRGIVVASAYREDGDDRYIELLIEVDAQAFPKLAQEIADGNIDSVSMGCEVESTICSYCGNEADDLGDFCEHVLHHKGQTLQRASANGEVEDVLVYEICRGVNFFEISFVFDPADETALAQTVLDARTARRKRAYDDRVAPQQVDTLTNSDPCPACGAEDFNGTQCRWCDYVTPPKELQDPDTSKAKEYDLRNEPEDDHGDAPDTDQEDYTMPRNPRDRQAAIRRLAEVNRAIAARRPTARRKRASMDWDILSDGQFTTEIPGGGIYVYETDEDGWAYSVRYGGEFSNYPDVDYADGFDTSDAAIAAAEREWANEGITARRRPTARRNTINREVNMNRRKQATRRRPTARRKQASSLSWKVDNGLLVADVPGGGFYQIDEGYRGDYYLSYHSFLGDTGDEIGDAFPSEEAAKAAANQDALTQGFITARRKRAYTTRDEAIDREIREPLGEYVDDFDIDAIADVYLLDYEDGYEPKPDADLWEIAERNDKTAARRHPTARRKQASELEPDEIPAYFPVKPLATQAEIDAAGDPVQDGECGLWWDDAISTSLTPAPGGRCPFEEYHEDDDGYYARRKRADADTDAAQPDERADLDETGDPVNSTADEEAAKPDEQVDVTTPDETQPGDATDTQYDPNEYENQGGAPVKASSMQALALVEAYEEHGIITNDERLAKFAELEKTSATIVQDRLDLLAQVKAAGAKAPTRTAKRSTVPRSATPQRPTPSMGRAASTGDTQLPDYLITL